MSVWCPKRGPLTPHNRQRCSYSTATSLKIDNCIWTEFGKAWLSCQELWHSSPLSIVSAVSGANLVVVRARDHCGTLARGAQGNVWCCVVGCLRALSLYSSHFSYRLRQTTPSFPCCQRCKILSRWRLITCTYGHRTLDIQDETKSRLAHSFMGYTTRGQRDPITQVSCTTPSEARERLPDVTTTFHQVRKFVNQPPTDD